MLERLRIKNFKLLRDVELELQKDEPTVLIGTNSSGKSTVIEVLDFLARCARDGLERAITAHGGMSAIRSAGATEPVEISSTWNFSAGKERERRRWHMTWTLAFHARSNGSVFVERESLVDGDRTLVDMNADHHRMVFDESEPSADPSVIESRKELAFDVLVDSTRYKGLGRLKNVVSFIRVLGAVASPPQWARASAERASARDSMILSTQTNVEAEGIGLAVALYNLHTDHGEAWQALERAFRGEYPFVKRIVFPADPGGARIAFAVEDERFPARKIYATEMSDGMVTMLCLLSLILHPAQRAVLALDEPDAHLHPSAIRRLMALMHVRLPNRRLLLATHSNAILDELSDPAASIRVVESTGEGTRIRKLEPEALKAWRSEYTLSEMRRTGLLDPSNSSYGSRE